MTYSLEFHERALAEFRTLDKTVRDRLKQKLAERLEMPHVPSARLSGQANRYKIKLKKPGIRLVYEVVDNTLVVYVIAIGKREGMAVYSVATKRNVPG